MPYCVHKATPDDIPALKVLLTTFMQETFCQPWRGTCYRLTQDGFGAEFEMVVAEDSNQTLIAFAAWKSSYDLHQSIKDGEVMDLFVLPAYRGQGVAIRLIGAISARIQQQGGSYIKGQAVENPTAQRLYQRYDHCFPAAEC